MTALARAEARELLTRPRPLAALLIAREGLIFLGISNVSEISYFVARAKARRF